MSGHRLNIRNSFPTITAEKSDGSGSVVDWLLCFLCRRLALSRPPVFFLLPDRLNQQMPDTILKQAMAQGQNGSVSRIEQALVSSGQQQRAECAEAQLAKEIDYSDRR